MNALIPAKKWSSNWWLGMLLLLGWGNMLVSYFTGILLRLPILSEFSDIIIGALYLIPLMFSFPLIDRELKIYDYLFYIGAIVILVFSALNPDNLPIIDEYWFKFAFQVLPFYFVGRLINFSRLRKSFLLISYLCVLASVFYNFVFIHSGSSNAEFTSYNMGASYAVLPHIMLIIAFAFWEPSLFKTIFSSMGFFLCISLGTRGPLVCLISFLLIFIIFGLQIKKKNTIIISVAVGGILLYYFFIPIVLSLQNLLQGLNMSTRIIDKFLANEIANDSGRGVLQDQLWNLLNGDDHFFGYGLFSSWHYIGTYPHNFLLDVLFSFGYLFGGIILIVFGILVIRAFKSSKTFSRGFLIILFCCSFLKLLLSNTFVFEPYLFMLIGYCIRLISLHNKPYPLNMNTQWL